MTTQTWVGGKGTNWDSTSPTNWNAATPAGGDTAYLDAIDLGSPITVTVDDSISVDAILWQSSATDTAAVDIVSGGYLTVGPSAGGTTFAGTATGASITVFAGGTLQIGTSTSYTNTISAAPVSVIFADDNPSAATVIWDSKSPLKSSKLDLTAFGQNDTLDVASSVAVTGLGTAYSAGVLTVTGSGGFSASVDISDGGSPTSSDFYATYNGGYVQITSDMPCFLRGTRIATLRGEVAVENLRIGDLVVTAIGGALPVKWIGTRGFITRLVNEHHRAAMLPIRIAAGALGEGSPVRDLYVSPEHMLCLDDVLIPADKLLNGTTVTRADGLDVVQYFHIELPRHAVLYAEGALAESFLDTGNRNMFANVLNYLELGCDLDAPPQPACLPIVTEGEALD
ncbi:MAG: Hint domain-containing protein, partial [Mycobacterium sp.]|nr:Hint domain-containing protein [Mycobacterium sp.]